MTGFPADTTQFNALQRDTNCYGQIFPESVTGAVPSWESVDPSVAECNFTGLTTARLPGATMIRASWMADSWFAGGNEDCEYTPVEVLREAFCEVIHNQVTFIDVELVGSSRSATFNTVEQANLDINTCGGERFQIKVKFRPPAAECCRHPEDTNLCYTRLASDNKFQYAPNPIDDSYEDWFGRDIPPYVIVSLRRRAASAGSNNLVSIHVGGTDYNGIPYRGRGAVKLNCP